MNTGTPRNVELAQLEQRAHWNPRTAMPLIEPGSVAEQDALVRIDELRDEELERQGDTFAARRRRSARHWSKHARHGGGH